MLDEAQKAWSLRRSGWRLLHHFVQHFDIRGSNPLYNIDTCCAFSCCEWHLEQRHNLACARGSPKLRSLYCPRLSEYQLPLPICGERHGKHRTNKPTKKINWRACQCNVSTAVLSPPSQFRDTLSVTLWSDSRSSIRDLDKKLMVKILCVQLSAITRKSSRKPRRNSASFINGVALFSRAGLLLSAPLHLNAWSCRARSARNPHEIMLKY